jgi:mannose-6-phosphate isomerase-like protein (cupin superfamily)
VVIQSHYDDIKSYVTKDGSIIRELMHPRVHGTLKMSLAEATVPEGSATALHVHRDSEEIYHITQGTGKMTLGDRVFSVTKGDTVRISPGFPHHIENTGQSDLIFLCCCCPAYSHEDSELLDSD